MSDVGPMSPEQAQQAFERAMEDAEAHGLWDALCPCGQSCGGRLASAGPPPTEDKYIACPNCGRVGTQSGIKWILHQPHGGNSDGE